MTAARNWVVALGAALGPWAPQGALACAVCASGTEEASRLAFILTTVFLSTLPLLIVGSLVWWLWRRTRDPERNPMRGDRVPEPAVDRAASAL